MAELEQERPSVSQDKQKINYENALHPSRSPQAQAQPLIDPVKAAALIEKGSSFAQKTMQKPLNFVGKIFQGLNEGGSSGEEEHQPRQGDYYGGQPVYQNQPLPPTPPQGHYHQQQQQQQQPYPSPNSIPHLPPRPLPPDPRAIEDARRAFDENLQSIITMFPNVEPDVCFMILQANDGQVGPTIDT